MVGERGSFFELGKQVFPKGKGSGESGRSGSEKAAAVEQGHLPVNGRRKALCYDWARESSSG